MIEFKNIEGIYFVGIGGIGMSALALYFAKGGYTIAGYDRSESRITLSLTECGCTVSYEDNVNILPDLFGNSSNKNKVLIVYTHAIPAGTGFFHISEITDTGFINVRRFWVKYQPIPTHWRWQVLMARPLFQR